MATGSQPGLIVLHEGDNVATALRVLTAGKVEVAGPAGVLESLTIQQDIALGHKVALVQLAAGTLIVKHGYPMGRATTAIARGEHVHVENVISLSRQAPA